jgi:hypothetical protein
MSELALLAPVARTAREHEVPDAVEVGDHPSVHQDAREEVVHICLPSLYVGGAVEAAAAAHYVDQRDETRLRAVAMVEA